MTRFLKTALLAPSLLLFFLLLLFRPAFGAAIKGLDEGAVVSYCKQIDYVGGALTLTNTGLNCILTSTAGSGGGDVTDVGDCSGSACFTSGGTGNTLYFEGSTADTIEHIITGVDPTVSDKTFTFPNDQIANNDLLVGSGAGTFSYIAKSSVNVGTATALAANGSNCSAGSAPLGVDASGVVESCTDYLETGDAIAGDDITDGSVDETELAANSVDSSELVDGSVDDSHLNTTHTLTLPVQAAKITGGFITAGASIDAGDSNWRLLFDASSTESAMWQFRMPTTYTSTLIAKLQYSMVSATSNKVDWEVDVQAVADGEAVITSSFDTTNEVTGGTTVPGTAGLLDSISISLTNDDSVSAGELVYIRVNRDHNDADDTASGDAELVGLTIEWIQ